MINCEQFEQMTIQDGRLQMINYGQFEQMTIQDGRVNR